MVRIDTVVCPVDFTDMSQRELDAAVAISQAFGSRLIIYHNVAAPPPGLTRGWEWDELHRTSAPDQGHAEQLLRRLMAALPAGVQSEACITTGSAFAALMALAATLPAQLIVMGSHGWSTLDHTSFGEQVVDRTRCPVLTIPDVSGRTFPLSGRGAEEPLDVLVATDFSPASSAAVDYALALAPALSWRLHLLHVVHRPGDAERAAQRLTGLAPTELSPRPQVYVACGDPTAQILEFVARERPALVVMGSHARGMLRRFLSHDTGADILHKAPVPVWFVPATTAQ